MQVEPARMDLIFKLDVPACDHFLQLPAAVLPGDAGAATWQLSRPGPAVRASLASALAMAIAAATCQWFQVAMQAWQQLYHNCTKVTWLRTRRSKGIGGGEQRPGGVRGRSAVTIQA